MLKLTNTPKGIKIIYDYISNVSSASIGVFVKTGSKDESVEELGLSHLIEHMMFKGTKNRNYLEISQEVDYLGGSINAYTSKEETVYYISVLKDYVEQALEILCDMLGNSLFDEDELEKEKDVIVEEIKMYQDTPDDLVMELNSKNCITGNLGKPIIGTEESVKSFTRDGILKYYTERYTKDNIVIVVSGNFKKEKIKRIIDKYFGSFNEEKIDRYEKIDFSFKNGEIAYEKDIKQVNICISYPGVSYLDSNRIYYDVVSNIMGGTMSSRLFQKIREEMGLAYSVHTFNQAYKEGGIVTTYIGTNEKSYKKAIKITKDEFLNLRRNGISSSELEKAQNKFLSKIAFSLENVRSRMNIIGTHYLKYGEIFDEEKLREEVKNVDLSLINDFIKDKYYEENVTILGDVKWKK